MKIYSAYVELEDRRPLDAGDVDQALEQLQEYHGSVGMSPRGWRFAQLSVPGETLTQATSTAAAVAAAALGGAGAIAVEVLTEDEFGAREGWVPLPELVNVTKAAELLGVSRQRVLQRINEKSLPGEKIGRDYAIPVTAIAATINVEEPASSSS